MKRTKRILALCLILAALSALLASPAAALTMPKKTILYMPGKKNWTVETGIDIGGLKKGQRIKTKSIKSSSPSVLRPTNYIEYGFIPHSLDNDPSAEPEYGATIRVMISKPGSAKLSFAMGSKKYSTQVIVKQYVNPLRSLVIPGVNGGKNVASAFRDDSFAFRESFPGGKKGVITAQAAEGWKITAISLQTQRDSTELSLYYWKGVKKAYLPLTSPLKKNSGYCVNVYLENTADHGRIDLCYILGNFDF